MKTQKQLKEQFDLIVEGIDHNREVEVLKKFIKTIYPQLEMLNNKKAMKDMVQMGLLYLSPFKNDDNIFEICIYNKSKRGVSSYNDQVDKFLLNDVKEIYKYPYNAYYSLGLHKIYKSYRPLENWNGSTINGFSSKEEMKKYEEIEYNTKGKPQKNDRATISNTILLGVLAIDLDANTDEELALLKSQVDRIEKLLNINSLKINTSAQGQQRLYLLDSLHSDMTLQEQFCISFWEAGIDLDLKIKDSSRMLRLPVGINNKAWTSQEKHQDLFKVEWENQDENFIKNNPYQLIQSLKNLKVRDIDSLNTKVSKSVKTEKAIKEVKKEEVIINYETLKNEVLNKRLSDEKLTDIYNCLSIKELPESIKLMLSYSPAGFRNQIIRSLNYYLTFDYPFQLKEENIKYILKQAGIRSNYEKGELDYQINYIVDNKQYFKLANQQELIALYGSYEHKIQFSKSNYIQINNMLINCFPYLKGDSFIAFLKLLIHEAKNGTLKEYTKEDLISIWGVSRKSVEKYISNLMNLGNNIPLIIKKKAKNKRSGDRVIVMINEKYYFLFNKGYEKFSPLTVDMQMERMTSSELKLYYYLRLKTVGDNKFSQSKIADDIGVSRMTIINLTNSLVEKKAIDKETIGKGCFKYTTYKVN